MTTDLTGPTASVDATARALARIGAAAAVVLVEGLSDEIALEAVAGRIGLDLAARRIVILPMGGAHAVRRYIRSFGAGVTVTGLCDVGEESLFGRVFDDDTHYQVCVADLEDELIRGAGVGATLDLLDREGDLAAFRTLQHQAAWRHRPVEAQLRRFLGSGARRKLRYARLLVEITDTDRLPRPLVDVLLGCGP